MPLNFLVASLSVVSIVTSIVVEGVKKVLDKVGLKYSSNLLAVIVSILITIGASIFYVVANEIEVSAMVIAEIVGMAFLSFLTSTIGYDKVVQMLKQVTFKNETDDKDNEPKE